ncbi:hypothetical protein [Butyrivibrio proteoclasticus]|uniref:hypothetical protein n=1 Tax=Butyrivibrio proteoclasticus TaxID=43305 RepID=UPI00047C7A4B|nr:hypothetical protein [Butyrivibrio proteoclasticus]
MQDPVITAKSNIAAFITEVFLILLGCIFPGTMVLLRFMGATWKELLQITPSLLLTFYFWHTGFGMMYFTMWANYEEIAIRRLYSGTTHINLKDIVTFRDELKDKRGRSNGPRRLTIVTRDKTYTFGYYPATLDRGYHEFMHFLEKNT